MLITHTFIRCLNCDEELEVFDDDKEVYCEKCEYINEICNNQVEFYEKEY